MMANDKNTQQALSSNYKAPQQMESTSLKFLDMISFIVRSVNIHNTNCDKLLSKLGIQHDSMGIGIQCYAVMLKQVHESFKFYFPKKYSHDVQFAIDEIFIFAAQLMTGQDLKTINPAQSVTFLKSLRICLKDKSGKEYLYRHLSQRFCDEIVVFLQLLEKYKSTTDHHTKLLIARDILKICIHNEGVFAINVSYECRKQVIFQSNFV